MRLAELRHQRVLRFVGCLSSPWFSRTSPGGRSWEAAALGARQGIAGGWRRHSASSARQRGGAAPMLPRCWKCGGTGSRTNRTTGVVSECALCRGSGVLRRDAGARSGLRVVSRLTGGALVATCVFVCVCGGGGVSQVRLRRRWWRLPWTWHRPCVPQPLAVVSALR